MTTPTQTEPLQLTVSNFGPIAKADIDLRPLTVFVGPSNTGKSYLAILIYALHGFFSIYTDLRHFRSINPILRKGSKYQHPLDDDDNVMRLLNWITDVLEQMETKSSSDASPIPLPDFIVSMVRSLLNDLSDFSAVIAKGVGRSFGIEDTIRLTRHGNRDGAKITLRCKLFEYQLALKRSKPEEGGISISEEIPLYIHPRRIIDVINTLSPGGGDRERRHAEYLIREIFSLLLSDIVKPLSNAAHYLPADRTGVMHAHRVVVASLIKQASHAGLRHDTPLPALPGVLADFLERLVGLSDLPKRRRNTEGKLAASLEQQILKGEIRSENSETGYPMFSYQPHGWQGDLPLMNASSMVSELAPVVLYLRHIVQPGDVLIIEEPESHLHPKMQVEFIRQLAAVVHSGIRVMLTTHSEWVLDELANLVRLSELPKAQRKGLAGANVALSSDQLGVWLFEPKQRPKGSVVKEIPFDEDFGGFRSGFDDVAIGTYNDYAEISNRIEQSSEHGKSR